MTDDVDPSYRAVAADGRAERGGPGDRWRPARRSSRCSGSIRTTRATERGPGGDSGDDRGPAGGRAAQRRHAPSSCDRSARRTRRDRGDALALLRAHPLPAVLLAVPAHSGPGPAPLRQRRPPRPGGVRGAGRRADRRGRPLRAARPAGPGGRGGVRGGGRLPGPRASARCCWSTWPTRPGGTGIDPFVAEVLPANGAMLRVFADFGYQVAAPVRRRRGAPDLPDRPDRGDAGRCSAAGSTAPRPAPSPGCSPRGASPSTAPAPPARASARRCWGTCATAASPVRSCRCTRARRRSAGLPAYPSRRRRRCPGRPGGGGGRRRTR